MDLSRRGRCLLGGGASGPRTIDTTDSSTHGSGDLYQSRQSFRRTDFTIIRKTGASQCRSLSPTGSGTSVTGEPVKTSSEHVIGFTRLIPSFKPLAERTL